jgi:UMF1 family MFS transporter
VSDPGQSGRRAVWSWCLYDFANSPFTTLVVTFIYATYFTKVIAPDEIQGTALWSRAVTLTALIVALLSPFMGALADRGGYRKLFLLGSTVVATLGSLGLYWIQPGAIVLALVVALMVFIPDAPKEPWFGLSTEGGENIRATNLLVAGWFVLFSVPMFLWVKEDRSAVEPGGEKILRKTWAQLRGTFVEIRKYRQIVRFLLARLIYNDGLVTVFAFGGIYAAGTFGFTFKEILIFGIVLNVTAGLGAVAMGFLDDKLGGRRTLEISLWALMVATILAVLAPTKTLFWVAGILLGIFSGPNQAASRSLMARFVPDDKENEFFGFFAFSGKATAFMGPFLLGKLTVAFGSQRFGVAVVIVFFIIGLILLRRVDEEEGIRMSGRGGAS